MRVARLFLIVILVLAIGATLSIRHDVTAQTNGSRGAYIALGDSITYGIGSSLPERRSYPVIVRDLLTASTGGSVSLVNLGVPGETAASFMTGGQLDAFIQEREVFDQAGIGVDVVSLTLGGNEMLAQRSGSPGERESALTEFQANLNEAVGRVRAAIGDNTILVLTTYYDLSEGDASLPATDAWWTERFNTVIRQTAESTGATVADMNDAFRGRIDDYTHWPYDVHPNNQGYRAIAAQVWQAIGLDKEPPQIRVVSASEATRRTPTLQLEIADNVDVADVRVTLEDAPAQTPVDLGEGHYVLLLDLRAGDAGEYSILVEAEDSAGNVRQIEQQIAMRTD